MEKQVQKCISIFRIFALFLLVGDLAYAATLIPENEAQVQSWFNSVIKPLGARKGTLERDLVEAESSPLMIKVRKDGSGNFKTITEAVNTVKIGNKKRVIISIGPGEYKEKIKVDRFKAYITFLGDPKNKPVLSFNGDAAKYGTVDSASLIVEADYFVGANLIVKNSSPRPDGKRKGAQAVAMRISGDMASFYNCRFLGFQDTVCDDRGSHFFKDCYIEGTVDFIFGDGRSIYLNTELHVIPGDPVAFITAHARKNNDDKGGYSFVHCKVTGTGGFAMLGRTWFDAARAVYSYCQFSNVVKAEGWSDSNKPHQQKMAYLGEYKNKGPGANTKGRVRYAKMLNAGEAQQFISMEYIEASKWLLPPARYV